MNDNKKEDETPKLLEQLFSLLEKHRAVFKQERVYNRMVALVMGELFAFGRHTITQLLLCLGLTDTDWSPWYRLFSRGRFCEEKMAAVMLKEVVVEARAMPYFVTGIDGFPVPRCSQKMPGTSWLRGLKTAKFRPGIERIQRFVEGSWFAPVENGYSRAIPLRCLPAFPAKAVASAAGQCKEWEAGWQYLHWLRAGLDENGAAEQTILSLADGSYDTIGFWAEKPERTVLVVRTARNRHLSYLPAPDAHGNCKYGDQAPAPYEWLRKRKGFKQTTVQVRAQEKRMRYRLIGPVVRQGLPHIPLFLLVIGGGKRPPSSRRKNYKPCFFLISALRQADQWVLPLPIEELLLWLWQRWELEVAHREMKSGLGLGQKQCWHPQSAIATVQWQLWLYGLLVLVGYRAWGVTGGPQPPGRWRHRAGRWSWTTLTRAIRVELWHHIDFQASWHRSAANWLGKEQYLVALSNSVLAASTI